MPRGRPRKYPILPDEAPAAEAVQATATEEAPVVRKPKVAPAVKVDYSGTDERLMLVQQFAPECHGPNAEFSAYFDDPSVPAEYYERRGYTAVTLPGGGQVNHKGDRLWKRPRGVVLAERQKSASMGRDLAGEARKPGSDRYAEGRLVELKD